MSKDKRTDAAAIHTAYDDHKPLDVSEPEKNLMRAILNSAIDDMAKSEAAKTQAKSYFLSQDEEYVYSFQSICTHLDLCDKTVLELVGLMKKAKDKS